MSTRIRQQWRRLVTFTLASGLPLMVAAKDYGLGSVAKQAYGEQQLQGDPTIIMGAILGVVLASLGIIFLVEIVVAGIQWMTARGNEEKITKSKDTLIHSIIGLLIVLAAYAIVNRVFQLATTVILKQS